ncbi:MAG TPA: hypothetical protein VK085_00780 [Pseudogracilibacillus sp.]|nr:hypothetical protein [Pseudogracilibacillus sp.]
MSASDVKENEVQVDHEDVNSLKGTLFSTIVFVGGGILIFILILFYFYMTRI